MRMLPPIQRITVYNACFLEVIGKHRLIQQKLQLLAAPVIWIQLVQTGSAFIKRILEAINSRCLQLSLTNNYLMALVYAKMELLEHKCIMVHIMNIAR